jgi:predicted dinucleotide-binding enzyme
VLSNSHEHTHSQRSYARALTRAVSRLCCCHARIATAAHALQKAAQESVMELEQALAGADMVFVTVRRRC